MVKVIRDFESTKYIPQNTDIWKLAEVKSFESNT